jgi:hypothetical protein
MGEEHEHGRPADARLSVPVTYQKGDVGMCGFMQTLKIQRWDDHRYYHLNRAVDSRRGGNLRSGLQP